MGVALIPLKAKFNHVLATLLVVLTTTMLMYNITLSEKLMKGPGSSAKEMMFFRNIFLGQNPGNSYQPFSRVPVFYNVYTNPRKVTLSLKIVKEQISHLLPRHELYIRSIGAQLEALQEETILRHDETGCEIETLEFLWQHCKQNPQDTVVYVHNKGSLHPSKNNDKMRNFQTRGALSQECMNMPSSCNVCSSRMSPNPHPHTSGNMWAAKCEYIQKLYDPAKFEEAMDTVFKQYNGREAYINDLACVGMDRFAAEHWVFSHPSVMPCDLSTSKKYKWNYDDIPRGAFEIKLESAPRFELFKEDETCDKFCPDEMRGHRLLHEYLTLYNETPTESWWGWIVYNNTFDGLDISKGNDLASILAAQTAFV